MQKYDGVVSYVYSERSRGNSMGYHGFFIHKMVIEESA